ncbi:Tyrosine N-monooxygenase [Hordeum vulgare]|nr:Tyrosine N-monooxygenase [Hordeum vulgare]
MRTACSMECPQDDHEFEVDENGEGIVDASKGRAGNYTTEKTSCYAIHGYKCLVKDKKTKKGKIRKGRPFTLPHCYYELKGDEKWKPREGVDEESNKRKRTIHLDDDEEESSSDGGKRSPTPDSVAYSKTNRPSGGKKEGK